jgi:hypothetical protein
LTLLSALNDAQRELSLAVTATIVADGQETQNLLYRLANKAAKEVLRRPEYRLPPLEREHSFTATTGATLQASGKPSNFERIIPDTIWNRSTDKKVAGPIDQEEWSIANGLPISSNVEQCAMLRYDGLHIFAAPTTGDTIAYQYRINTPVQATGGGSYKTAFSADTDEYLLGDELLTLDVVWRYKREKGRDYAENLKDFELALQAISSGSSGARRAYVASPDGDAFGVGLIPDGNYPSP